MRFVGSLAHQSIQEDETFWFRDRQRAEQKAVDEGKDRGVGPDAEGERQNRNASDDRSGAEHTNGDPQILSQAVNETDSVHLVNLLPHQGDVPKLPSRPDVRLLRRQTRTDVVVDEQVEVCADLVAGLFIEAAPGEGKPKPRA